MRGHLHLGGMFVMRSGSERAEPEGQRDVRCPALAGRVRIRRIRISSRVLGVFLCGLVTAVQRVKRSECEVSGMKCE